MVFEFVTSLISSKNFSLTYSYFLQFIMKCSSFSFLKLHKLDKNEHLPEF